MNRWGDDRSLVLHKYESRNTIGIYAALGSMDVVHLIELSNFDIKAVLKDFIESIAKCPKLPISMVSKVTV